MLERTGRELIEAGRGAIRYFPDARTAGAEATAVSVAISLAADTGSAVYIVHLSSAAALDRCRQARSAGLPVYVETRPLYLHLTRSRFTEPDAAKYAGAPPLREQADRDALWHGLARVNGCAAAQRRSRAPGHEVRRQDGAMDESARGQLRVIRKVIAVTQAAEIPVWLFGGWGLDARIGRITRQHGDIEFWVEHIHAERSKAVLVEAGARALTVQPPAEACEFMWDGAAFSTAYFDRQPDGSFSQPRGRFSDWLFPPGSFGDEPGMLDGTPVPAMSISGMLAMKEQFPHLRNGRPWRQKDIDDMQVLRRLENRR